MYDVVWNVCDLANIRGVDLETAFARKAAVDKEREWPGANGGS
jgi:NTP pyrophosphatase (non-canonical NTP hydrolase)